MKIIGFGKLSYHLLIILISPCLNEILNQIILRFRRDIIERPLLFTFFASLGAFIVGIFAFIQQCLWKVRQQNQEENLIVDNYHAFDRVQKRKKIMAYLLYPLLILTGFYNCFYYFIASYLSSQVIVFDLLYIELFQIPFTSLFSRLFLKYKYFKHHYIAYGMIVIGFSILFLVYSIGNLIIFYHVLVLFCFSLIRILIDIWQKRLMLNSSLTPMTLFFYEGQGYIIFSIIMIFIAQNTKCEGLFATIQNFCISGQPIESFSKFNVIMEDYNLLLFVLYMFFSGGFEFNLKLINYYFTPTHTHISSILVSLVSYMFSLLYDNPMAYYENILALVSLVIMLFGITVFNEIIILYCCGLESNTYKIIMQRGDDDDLEIFASVREINARVELKADIKTEINNPINKD